ncbi:MAG: hypothetical protein SPK32_08530 [Bacteroidaceae bacterium]|nr:hypothetical protein [Bacteroidaceae bacterium]
MKKISIKWFKSGLIGLLAIFGMASCSDDHFDLNTTNATGTLWENLVASGQADDFTKILEKTIVNKKSYGIPATITYKELLNSPRVFTVWAPKDGTYDAQKWLDLLAEGKNEVVEKQFVRNHIANYNYSGAYAKVEKIMLYNSKYAEYNVPENTFKGVSISSDPKFKNIPSTNGTLHILENIAPYAPSLREVIETETSTSDMYEYILDKDTLMFIEWLSTEGSTVNGKIQYVDSYFVESNKILPSIAMNEDSISAAIIPSNTAWQEAIAKIEPFFNLKNKYTYFDEDLNKFVTDSVRADSLKELYAKRVIFNNMFYSLREQPGFNYEDATVSSVKNFFETADSLVSTAYYLSSYEYHQHAPYCNTLTEGKTPLEASNGYAFITDHFNFHANKAWQYDIVIEAEHTYYLNQHYCNYLLSSSPSGIRHQVTDGNRNDSVQGRVRSNAYQEFAPSSSASKPVVSFNIPNVLSGTYDIYGVFVPENMTDPSNMSPKANKFTATLMYDFDAKGKASEIKSEETFVTNTSKVDTILLFKDFKFPYSYYGVSKSAPVLSLQTVLSVADRKTITPTLYIDCFILKGKDE